VSVEYVVLKWLHVLSSTVLFGTGLGSAYYMFFASRTRDPRTIATVVGHVVVADAIFTASTIVFQPLSGWRMAHLAGLPLTTPWIAWSIALYLLAGACWLPVVWMQIRMRGMAERAAADGVPMPDAYYRWLRVWVALGIPAFVSLVVVFWLMVAKPT
jgi:uncharacterized membrane protein